MKSVDEQIKAIEAKIAKLEAQKAEIEKKIKVEKNNLQNLQEKVDAEAMADIKKLMVGGDISMDDLKLLLMEMEEKKKAEKAQSQLAQSGSTSSNIEE